jgi:SAM-dependent methyltransferase
MSSTNPTTNAVREQLEYYRSRAAEYDQWWLRRGRYDRGEANNANWFAEADEVKNALQAFQPAGKILELAAGTGIWTEQLLPFADELTVVDGSPEMLAINAARVGSSRVSRIEADLFAWRSASRFDTVFFGFWLSHLPPERFADFWRMVRDALAPGGRVFFVDSRREPTSTARDHQLPERTEAQLVSRKLNDGREFQVYKIFNDPGDLEEELRQLGWWSEVRVTTHYFLHGTARPC